MGNISQKPNTYYCQNPHAELLFSSFSGGENCFTLKSVVIDGIIYQYPTNEIVPYLYFNQVANPTNNLEKWVLTRLVVKYPQLVWFPFMSKSARIESNRTIRYRAEDCKVVMDTIFKPKETFMEFS